MVNAHASWRNSTGSKSKQHDNIVKHTYAKLERDTTKFDIVFTLGRSNRKIFVWLLLGPYARA